MQGEKENRNVLGVSYATWSRRENAGQADKLRRRAGGRVRPPSSWQFLAAGAVVGISVSWGLSLKRAEKLLLMNLAYVMALPPVVPSHLPAT